MRYDPAQLSAMLPADRSGPQPVPAGPARSDRRLGDLVAHLIETAPRLLGATGSGLMLLDQRHRLRCVGASDDRCRRLEDAQLRARSGPGWDAVRCGRPVAVADLAADPRYRDLAAGPDGGWVGAALAMPLTVAGRCAGVLQFYREDPAAWTSAQSAGAAAFAGVIAALLVQAVAARRSKATARQLLQVLEPGGQRSAG
jgi:GAF domain-containing protein